MSLAFSSLGEDSEESRGRESAGDEAGLSALVRAEKLLVRRHDLLPEFLQILDVLLGVAGFLARIT